MMRKISFFSLFIFNMALVSFASASTNDFADPPEMNCEPPSLPEKIHNQGEYNSSQASLDAYHDCVQNYAKQQAEVAKHHEKAAISYNAAASKAISVWNDFANNYQKR